MRLKDGQPCNHTGCLNHITNPCEWCGRVGGVTYVGVTLASILNMHEHMIILARDDKSIVHYKTLKEETISSHGDPR